jgi:Ca2+-binding EF-hand superfamily protein
MKYRLAAFVIALSAPSPLHAQDPLSFGELDRDRDGAVTRSEFDRAARIMFDEIDKDRSGMVTQGEFRSFAMRQMMSGKRPAFMKGKRPDLRFDKKGEMAFQSFSDGLWSARFAKLDANGDGRLSAAEFNAGTR